MPGFHRSRFPARQRGATLVVAMIVLVLIMMIGIAAISTSDTQFKLAGNLQFEDSALNNAETGIATAERWLASNHMDPAFTTPDPSKPWLLPMGYLAALSPATTSAARAFAMDAENDPNSQTVNGDTQRYFIEQVSKNTRLLGSGISPPRASSGCNQVNTFLITARGVSARGATKYVQSYYSVLSCSS